MDFGSSAGRFLEADGQESRFRFDSALVSVCPNECTLPCLMRGAATFSAGPAGRSADKIHLLSAFSSLFQQAANSSTSFVSRHRISH